MADKARRASQGSNPQPCGFVHGSASGRYFRFRCSAFYRTTQMGLCPNALCIRPPRPCLCPRERRLYERQRTARRAAAVPHLAQGRRSAPRQDNTIATNQLTERIPAREIRRWQARKGTLSLWRLADCASLKELTSPVKRGNCLSARVNPILNVANNLKLYLNGGSTALSLPQILPNFQPNESRAYSFLQVSWRLPVVA